MPGWECRVGEEAVCHSVLVRIRGIRSHDFSREGVGVYV